MNGKKKEKEKNQKKKNIIYVSKYFIKYINNIYIYNYIYTYKNNEKNFSNFSYLASLTTS